MLSQYINGYQINNAQRSTRTFHVGSGPEMFATIQAAIDAINALTVPPSSANRCAILIWPGTYTMTLTLTIPGYCAVIGIHKGATRLINATTDMFTSGGHSIWYENFLVEGSTTTAAVFNLNNKDNQHIRNVDCLNNSGANTQRFILQNGATWRTMFIERCVIDSYKEADYVNWLFNTSGAAREVDVEVNDVFLDTNHLTNYGGGFLLRQASDIRFRNCKIRGKNAAGGTTYQTGIRHELNGATGTPTIDIFTTYFSGTVSIYGTSGTNFNLMNSEAIGAISDGTKTVHNSTIT
jgi:hypothetical protein